MISKLIVKFWKKALYLLITGSSSVFIAACYGPPVGYGYLGNWTIRTQDKENKPIQGLQVTVLQFVGNSSVPDTFTVQKTDSTGTLTSYLSTYNKKASHRHEAIVHDIDSIQNGGLFKDTIITKSNSEESTVIMRLQE